MPSRVQPIYNTHGPSPSQGPHSAWGQSSWTPATPSAPSSSSSTWRQLASHGGTFGSSASHNNFESLTRSSGSGSTQGPREQDPWMQSVSQPPPPEQEQYRHQGASRGSSSGQSGQSHPTYRSSTMVSETQLAPSLPAAVAPASQVYASPSLHPQFQAKAVCRLTCKSCLATVCNRGMKAILLADARIELYSTDRAPLGVQLVYEDYRTRNCKCRIRDVACLGCGNTLGAPPTSSSSSSSVSASSSSASPSTSYSSSASPSATRRRSLLGGSVSSGSRRLLGQQGSGMSTVRRNSFDPSWMTRRRLQQQQQQNEQGAPSTTYNFTQLRRVMLSTTAGTNDQLSSTAAASEVSAAGAIALTAAAPPGSRGPARGQQPPLARALAGSHDDDDHDDNEDPNEAFIEWVAEDDQSSDIEESDLDQPQRQHGDMSFEHELEMGVGHNGQGDISGPDDDKDDKEEQEDEEARDEEGEEETLEEGEEEEGIEEEAEEEEGEEEEEEAEIMLWAALHAQEEKYLQRMQRHFIQQHSQRHFTAASSSIEDLASPTSSSMSFVHPPVGGSYHTIISNAIRNASMMLWDESYTTSQYERLCR
ncbi:Protein fam72a [Actinomortierella ambigua]|nr:Protein fam72a [Actinomortierella ambigua]